MLWSAHGKLHWRYIAEYTEEKTLEKLGFGKLFHLVSGGVCHGVTWKSRVKKKSFLASLHRLWCSFRKICLVKSPNPYLERLERFKKSFLLGQRDFWLRFLFNEILVKIYIEMRTRLSLNFFSAFTLLHFVKHFVKISYFLGTWNTFYTSNPQTQHSVLAWLQQQLSFTMFSLICPKANVTPESNIESWEQVNKAMNRRHDVTCLILQGPVHWKPLPTLAKPAFSDTNSKRPQVGPTRYNSLLYESSLV